MTAFMSSLREGHIGAALGLRAAKGQHTPAEAAALAEPADHRRAVAEIGVAEGMSAALLRSVMDPAGVLWLIDPFERRHGVSAAYLVARRTVRRSRGAEVRWVRQYSTVAGPTWSEPLDFVFLDGDHSEE